MCCKLASEFPSGVPPPPHTSYGLTIAYRFLFHIGVYTMTILYVIILFMMLLFKTQAKALLSAIVQLVQALATAIAAAMKS